MHLVQRRLRRELLALVMFLCAVGCSGAVGNADMLGVGSDNGDAGNSNADDGGQGHTDAGSGNGTDGGPGGTDGGSDIIPSRCTKPTCSQSNNICTVSEGTNWDVYDNQWNCGAGSGETCGPETVYVCSGSSWYVVSDQPAGNTAVLSYVSTQVNYNSVPLSSFNSITSTFSEVSPHVGDYEAAYDVFFNPGNQWEVMVWVDNYNQTPGGGWNPIATNVSVGGSVYNVYQSGSTIYYVAVTNFTSGTVDLLAIFHDATNQRHWLPASVALEQIQFGWEICSTNGQNATFYLDEFSLMAN